MRRTLVALTLATAIAAVFVAPVSAISQTVVFNNIPSALPGNLASVAFEATSTSEWGTQVHLAGTDRHLTTATVTLSSWGCQVGTWNGGNCVTTPGATFSHPITFNVYAVGAGNAVGALLATTTVTFAIPYRPTSDPTNCTGDNAGKWYDGTACYSGKVVNAAFDFSSLDPVLPDTVIIGIAYNTSDYGASPIGSGPACHATPAGCPYDSLNVATYPGTGDGTAASVPSVGTFPLPLGSYLNSSWAGAYGDGGAVKGTFRLDPVGWGSYQPAVRLAATTPVAATPTPIELVGGETNTPPRNTPPPTNSGSGSGDNSTPLIPVLICLAFGGLGLAAVEAQRRNIRS